MYAFEPCCLGELIETYDKGLPCHWTIPLRCFVGKKRAVDGRIVDLDMLVESI